MARMGYLLDVISRYATYHDTSCPHCDSHQTHIIGRKYILLQLRKCKKCQLLFRYPKDNTLINQRFYSGQYQELSGITTYMPSDNELSEMITKSFVGTGKDFAEQVAILQSYIPSGKVFDYGASWGYGTWQIQQAGYDVTGFEIDVARAQYGRDKLGLNFYTSWAEFKDTGMKFDAIFTSHVLEHLPDLRTTFADFNSLLKPDGLLLIFVPNSTGIENPSVFKQKKSFAFGEKHTFAFTADFFEYNLPRYGLQVKQVDVQPYGEPKPNLINGSQLLVAAIKQTMKL